MFTIDYLQLLSLHLLDQIIIEIGKEGRFEQCWKVLQTKYEI